ncbi:conjugal transfer protein TraN [Psychroflexus sp. S27]|uniref:DUF4138 domain-containing protein n=1 Tax=Psychroflexus sp. S27 TaxID=1982757 RepID=UPI000C2992F0|nr:DUF4138 domain-containing protein [Psychroflexus sp. S27]PJX21942.1 conjugal transfer protein TraN [Psychroflexus sp. S27]
MKTILLTLTIVVSSFIPRQTLGQINKLPQKALDTIYANDTKNVALFFPKPIRQGLTGADNFVFTFNREKEQHLGLLQAKPGKESNLLVINNNGSVFSYIVMYKKHIDRLNYFIPTTNSIGNERPKIKDSVRIKAIEKRINFNTYYHQKFCSYLLVRKQRLGLIKKRNEGIVMSVENIVFDKNELYFVIQIQNKSTLDYDLNFLKFSIETRKKGKKKSLQRLYQEPIFTYNLPSKIAENETIKLIYVLPKFSISNDRRAILELNEKNGERNLKLKISHRFINNPN